MNIQAARLAGASVIYFVAVHFLALVVSTLYVIQKP
jgi:hypothetical protein